ncbi:hypothetical protein PY365_28630 [Roseiarcaceae bacterium H3SJ34-1]|uniref:hypothetical protein n=1 Tax=Terripilifer ovatus TaxID=3032367 RepID=UPI003AB93B0D|nr:hypothetical protein [Roseiarcaceae bacterium H3SJ34-1]
MHRTVAAILLLSGLALNGPVRAQSPPIVGNDRDRHGCIASAGYAWCRYTAKCERPWELASQRGFANEPKAFGRFCNRRPPQRHR